MRISILLTFVLMMFASSVFAFAGGNGTAASPYQVSTLMELHEVRNDLSAHYIQIADIDASATNTWNFDLFNGFLYRGWDPIGSTYETAFTGVYDGGGHTITGVVIRREDNTGLFGYIRNATVKNLNLSGIWYSGHAHVGAITANAHESTITNCHTDGYIWSNDVYIGGIVGTASNGYVSNCSSSMHLDNGRAMGGIAGNASNVFSCIFTGQITAAGRSVGGIVGSPNHSTISNCYNTGSITTTGENAGGIAGTTAYNVVISHCYSIGAVSAATGSGGLVGEHFYAVPNLNTCIWDIQASGQSTSSGGGIGLTTLQMKEMYRYVDAGWDIDPENTSANGPNAWRYNYNNNSSRPSLAWEGYLHIPIMPPGGAGTEASPYTIGSKAQLNWALQIVSSWNKHFQLTADIDANGTELWHDGAGATPIGTSSSPFTGDFDGQGHIITDFYNHHTTESSQGFFGYAHYADIRNLGLESVDIHGDASAGGLIGLSNSATVENCFTSGVVRGEDYTGGLIGMLSTGSDVSNCYSRAYTYGDDIVGSFAGDIRSSTVVNCFGAGQVVGDYSASGFAGGCSSSTVSNCFWCTNTAGSTSAAGTGLTTSQMSDGAIYRNAGWDLLGETTNGVTDVWGVDNTTNDGYPFLAWNSDGELHQDFGFALGETAPLDIPNVGLTVQFDGTQAVTTLDVVQEFTEPGVFGVLPSGVVELLDTWWEITPFGGDAGTYDITFDTSDISGITDFTLLRILKRENSSSPWVDARDLGATIVSNLPYITASGLDAFSDFVLALGDGSTLPVTLSSFTATVNSDMFAQLEWETQSETDMSGYNLYRNTENDDDAALLVNGAMIEATNAANATQYSFVDVDVDRDATYFYWLEAVELDGSSERFGPVSVTITPEGGGGETPEIPLVTDLQANYPNPFNPSTTIRFSISEGQTGELTVFNLRGQKVRGWSGFVSGDHAVVWDGRDAFGHEVGGGVYLYRLQTDSKSIVKRMMLLK